MTALKIYTQLNIKMAESAERAVVEGVKEIDKRQGRGPAKRLKPEEADLLQARGALGGRCQKPLLTLVKTWKAL